MFLVWQFFVKNLLSVVVVVVVIIIIIIILIIRLEQVNVAVTHCTILGNTLSCNPARSPVFLIKSL
jgi:hypothetical protein